MTINASGPISLAGGATGASIAIELGLSSTAQISLSDTVVRTLLGVASGQISFSDAYSKSANTGYTFSSTISSNTTNYNLYNAAISAGWNGTSKLTATVTINSGVYVYSTSTGTYAFTTGSGFPTGSTLTLINNGTILGRGGNGGSGFTTPYGAAPVPGGSNHQGVNGLPGGPALQASYAISITNNGVIAGGGGGGGTGAWHG